jgi:hypothetical protein
VTTAPAAPPALRHTQTTNWAGYVAHAKPPYTSVTARWTQPKPVCATGENSAVSAWVGLDGYPSTTIEQVGADADCVNGAVVHGAWYEFYPAAPVYTSNKVNSGDTLTAVAQVVAGRITLTITDKEGGWTWTVSKAAGAVARASAEVIVEDPFGPQGQVPLARFTSIPFHVSMVNGKPLAAALPERFVMAPTATVRVAPSRLDDSGKQFIVSRRTP